MAKSLLERIDEHRSKIAELKETAAAMCEGRDAADFTQDEINQLEELEESVSFREDQLSACMRLHRLSDDGGGAADGGNPPTRRTAPSGGDRGPADYSRNPAAMARRDATMGFHSLGDFARSVRQMATPGSHVDPRVALMAASTWSGEQSGTDGGHLVPPEFSANVMKYVGDQSSLFDRCQKTPVNVALSWPQDEEAPWSTSGPQAYWEGEGDAATASKVKLTPGGNRLGKLVCLCPVTDELLEDAPQLASYLERTIASRIKWKVDKGIISGTGVGQGMTGILKAKSLKTVAKEGSQTAATINSTNVLKMWNGCYGDFRGSATWIYNQDCELQLLSMVIAGSSSDVPVFLPSGPYGSNLAGAPYSTLLGRPAIAHQACSTLGTVGDILLCDLSQYLIGYKTMGPVPAMSMHFYFDQSIGAFRMTWRLCGQPLWSKTIAAANGSGTYSPFVALATRA